MACTRKSSRPHWPRSVSNTLIDAGGFSTSQGRISSTRAIAPVVSRACERLALIGKGELRALRRKRFAMPQQSNDHWRRP